MGYKLGRKRKTKFAESLYGTVVVATSNEDLQMLRDSGIEINVYLSNITYKNGQNVIVSNPRQIYRLKDVIGYKNIIFLHRYFDEEHLFYTQLVDVYENPRKTTVPLTLSSVCSIPNYSSSFITKPILFTAADFPCMSIL